jgi:hypothetical protein
VHALIERESKNKLIYTPQEWMTLVRWAKKDGKPYIVKEMSHNIFFNYKELLNGKNWTVNTRGQKVQWTKIKELFISASDPQTICYKYDLSEDFYYSIHLKKNTTRCRQNNITLTPLYPTVLLISKQKKDDLIHLCDSGVIPVSYHDFLKSLVTSIDNIENSDSE